MRAQRGQLAVLELAAPVVLDLLRTAVHQQPGVPEVGPSP